MEILPPCVLPPGKYALSGGNGGINLILAVYDAQGGWLKNLATSYNGVAAVVQIEALGGSETYHRVIFEGTSGTEVNNVVLSPQLEAGGTATAFEPYEDIPFLTLDNAAGQMQRVAVEVGCRAKQAGTGAASPANVRAITGREGVEVRACGKNLFDYLSEPVRDNNSATHTVNDGVISVTPGGARSSGIYYSIRALREQLLGQTVTLSFEIRADASFSVYGMGLGSDMWNVDASTEWQRVTKTSVAALTQYNELSFYQYNAGTPVTFYIRNIQIERGSTATEYEPYRSMGGGGITPSAPLYGLPGVEDTVGISADGDVLVTHRTGALIIDGEQCAPYASGFGTPEGVYAYTAPLTGSGALAEEDFPGICSHFAVIPHSAVQSERTAGTVMLGVGNSGVPQAWFFTTHATAEAFNGWLQQQQAAGTPVTIVYELAEPETEALAAVTPIAPQPGTVNIATDADSLAATVYGSGWETVNDTTDVRDGLGNAESNIDSMLSSITNVQSDVSSMQATLEIMPGEIKSQVLQSDEFQAVSSTVTQTSNGLAVVKEQVEVIDGEVQTLTGVIVVSPPNIDIGSSDSSTKLHLDNEGWDILSEGQAVISARENKVVSPRFHVMDALMIGNLAFRPSGGHLRLLKYGG